MNPIDVEEIRKEFPIFKRKLNGKTVAYLDNAATSLKPDQVIEAIDAYHTEYTANVHRGVYRFSEEATEAYESARKRMAEFVSAGGDRSLIFTKNATEALNLVAGSWGTANVKKGDAVVTTIMEHHSNFVTWQQLAKENGAKFDVVGIDKESYELDLGQLEKKLKKARVLAIVHVSNVLGTITPIKDICELAAENGVITVVDGAQSTPHLPIDIKKLGCDFFVFTGHKLLGPSGIGGLIGKNELLEKMKPYQYGGDMIREVHVKNSTWNDLPYKFEAGTPNISGAIGLGAAVEYLEKLGMDKVREHEKMITKYALLKLSEIKGLTTYGPELAKRSGAIAFNLKGVHPHDVAAIVDEEAIAIRSGHHCAMPLHEELGLEASNRASFYIYNTRDDVDRLCAALLKAKKIFGAK
jgi:cysteine desulfurase/selenocysteine lyase